MNVDAIVLAVCCTGFALVIGMGIGERAATDRIATRCEEQPGAKLIATHQAATGTLCTYANAYGQRTWTTKATSPKEKT